MTDEELLEFWQEYWREERRAANNAVMLMQRIKQNKEEIINNEQIKTSTNHINYSTIDLLYGNLLSIEFPCGCRVGGRCDDCCSIRPKI